MVQLYLSSEELLSIVKFSRAVALAGFLLASIGWGIAHGAEPTVWQPSPGHTQIPIWPGAVPDVQAVPGPEAHSEGAVTNVTRPTMTVYSPDGRNTGAAIIVKTPRSSVATSPLKNREAADSSGKKIKKCDR